MADTSYNNKNSGTENEFLGVSKAKMKWAVTCGNMQMDNDGKSLLENWWKQKQDCSNELNTALAKINANNQNPEEVSGEFRTNVKMKLRVMTRGIREYE